MFSVWEEFCVHVPGNKPCFMNLYPKIQGNILLTKEGDSIVLTKDLLCFRTKSGKIQPKFIATTSPKFLEIAIELTDLFSRSVGEDRGDLENRSKQVLDRYLLTMTFYRGCTYDPVLL